MNGHELEHQEMITAPTFQRLMEEIDRVSQLYIHQHPTAMIFFINNIDGGESHNDVRTENGISILSEGFNPFYSNGNWHQAVWMSPS